MSIDIHNLLSTVADELTTDVDFFFGDSKWQNYEVDVAVAPILYVHEPVVSNDIWTQGGRIIEAYDVELLFGKVAQDGWVPKDHHDNCVQPMRILRQEYIERLLTQVDSNNIKMVETITNIKTSNVINLFDVLVSGVIVTLRIQPYDHAGQCL